MMRESTMMRGDTMMRESTMMRGDTMVRENTMREGIMIRGNIMKKKLTIKERIKIESAERRRTMKERAARKGALNKYKSSQLFSSFFLID